MNEPTFHTVSWAPSAIKDAVEHASAAFKAADGAFARVSTFELSALIDATRALIEHNDQADAQEHSFEEFKAALLPIYGADEYADHTPGQLAEMAAEELMQLRVDRIKLSWLHAEANHHRAQVETQGLSHALLLKGVPDLLKQIDAQAQRIREQDAELAELRGQHEPAKPCSCNGGWSVDENYQPEDYEAGQPLRPEKGLIPCGLCNHGGWDAPWPPRKPRLRACVERWPACEEGAHHPSCCRYPKSCSATVYDAATVKPEELEAPRG